MKIYVDSEAGLQPKDLKVSIETNPCSEVDIDSEKKMDDKELMEAFQRFFADPKKPTGPPPKIVTYDDTGKSVKISERYPLFGFATLIDDILDEFGGVEEIMECQWVPEFNEGLVVCLMKDWRVFRLNLKSHEYASLTHDDRRSKITANISSSDDNMIRRLMQDKVLSFYISGKLTENKNKEVETIVISKISPHVDQTAYAKRFQKVKEKSGITDDFIIKDKIFNEPNVDMSKIVKAVDAWNKFRKITKDVVMEYDDLKKKEASIFSKWKKALKSKLT